MDPRPASSPAAPWLRSFVVRYGLAILLIVIWQLVTMRANSLFFPTPVQILGRAYDLWLSGPAHRLFLGDGVFKDILPSLFRLLSGWIIAVVVGTSVGVLIGRSQALHDLVDPALQFLRAIPGPALIPAFLILFGTETTMRVTLIAFGSIWPVLLNTIEGARTVDPLQLDTAKSFKLPPFARFTRIILPAALPKIMAGAKVSLSLAVILMVVSELVAATNGIGYRILDAQIMLLLPDLWCGIVLLALIGFGLNAIFERVEQRVLHWHRGARQR
jgi:ABC-type nitrate/sulfonate/bicarbonate transport system permease component